MVAVFFMPVYTYQFQNGRFVSRNTSTIHAKYVNYEDRFL